MHYNHTCWLKLDIFFLNQKITDQNFIAAILFFVMSFEIRYTGLRSADSCRRRYNVNKLYINISVMAVYTICDHLWEN